MSRAELINQLRSIGGGANDVADWVFADALADAEDEMFSRERHAAYDRDMRED